jgi:hypothetical protein
LVNIHTARFGPATLNFSHSRILNGVSEQFARWHWNAVVFACPGTTKRFVQKRTIEYLEILQVVYCAVIIVLSVRASAVWNEQLKQLKTVVRGLSPCCLPDTDEVSEDFVASPSGYSFTSILEAAGASGARLYGVSTETSHSCTVQGLLGFCDSFVPATFSYCHCHKSKLEIFTFLGCYARHVGSYRRFRTTYRSHLQGCLTLDDCTDRLYRNVGNELPSYAA